MKAFVKSFYIVLPLAACITGCGNSDNNSDAGNSATTPPTGNAVSPAATAEPPAGYKVADDADPNMSPAAVAALQKAKLPPPPASMKVPAKARVLLTTSKGPITLELDGKAAPLHVKSFLYLSQKGFYNGTIFHRFADLYKDPKTGQSTAGGKQGRIIQGGDPLTKDPSLKAYYGGGGPGSQIPREYNGLKHDKLMVAMARSSDPNSAGSQFYITQDPVPFLDENDGYTVFGKVVDGQKAALQLRQGDVIKRVDVLPTK